MSELILSETSKDYREGFAAGYFTACVYIQRRLRDTFRAVMGGGYQEKLYAWTERGGSLPKIDEEE